MKKKTTRKKGNGESRDRIQSREGKKKKETARERKITLGRLQSTLHNPDNLHHLKLWGGKKEREKGRTRILFAGTDADADTDTISPHSES